MFAGRFEHGGFRWVWEVSEMRGDRIRWLLWCMRVDGIRGVDRGWRGTGDREEAKRTMTFIVQEESETGGD